jgi:hypothetical protein
VSSPLKLERGKSVEGTQAGEVEKHKERHVPVDGNHDNDAVVDDVTVSSENVENWPPVHPLVDNKRKEVPSSLVEVFEVVLVIGLLLVELGVEHILVYLLILLFSCLLIRLRHLLVKSCPNLFLD